MNTMYLSVPLTAEEKIFKGQQLGELYQKIESQEMAKKEAVKAHDSSIQTLKKSLGEMSRIVAEGKERREVQVEDRKDWTEKVVITFRLDTGDEVTRRPMNPYDMQDELPLEPPQEPAPHMGE